MICRAEYFEFEAESTHDPEEAGWQGNEEEDDEWLTRASAWILIVIVAWLLIYLKPAVYGREPFDVLNYAKANPDFPNEAGAVDEIGDTQFESYRRLGLHAVEEMCAYAGLQPEVQSG